MIFAFIIKFPAFVQPMQPLPIANHFLYNAILQWLTSLIGKNIFWFSIIALFTQVLQALYIVNITLRHRIFPKITYVPAWAYILLSSAFPPFNTFGETQIINWILLGALDIMLGFSQTMQPRKLIFNGALVLCCAALFQFTFVIFFLLLLVAMAMLRPFNIGEWAVAFMGFVTPVYFFCCLLFLANNFDITHHWVHLGFSADAIKSYQHFFGLKISGLILFFLAGLYGLQMNLTSLNIYFRRNWIVIVFYLGVALLAGLATDGSIVTVWLVIVPPLSIITSYAFLNEKNKFFNNTMFYLSLVLAFFFMLTN